MRDLDRIDQLGARGGEDPERLPDHGVHPVVPAEGVARDAEPPAPEGLAVEVLRQGGDEVVPPGRRDPIRRRVLRVDPRHRREELGGVGDGAGHRPGRVLGVRDRHHAGARHQADGGLDPHDAVGRRRADDRAVGLRADGPRREVGRDGDAGARARAARVAVERVRVARLAADGAPAGGGAGGAEVGPFGQVRLALDHGPGGAQAAHQESVLRRRSAGQGKRPRRRAHPVARLDVVLEEDREAVERPARGARRELGVEGRSDRLGLGVELEDRVQPRGPVVELRDPPGVRDDQIAGRAAAGRERRAQLGERALLDGEERLRVGEQATRARGDDAGPGHDTQAQELAAAQPLQAGGGPSSGVASGPGRHLQRPCAGACSRAGHPRTTSTVPLPPTIWIIRKRSPSGWTSYCRYQRYWW